MIHVHSGSQGLSLDTMVAGVKAIVEELANDPRVSHLIDVIDIGGGFPVDFSSTEDTVTMPEYVAALQRAVPSLFHPSQPSQQPGHNLMVGTRKRLIITEFGRTIAARAGIFVSRVEYVKYSGGRQIVLQHIGADLAVRTVWQPRVWPLRIDIYDEVGQKKNEKKQQRHPDDGTDSCILSEGAGAFALTDVCGPCCMSGCMVARQQALPHPVIPLKDLVVVHDVGAYYHSSFSLYNLRQMPACFMMTECEDEEADDAHMLLYCIRKPQTVLDTAQLFSTQV